MKRKTAIDAKQFLADLDTLATFGASPQGINRIAYSASDLLARDWIDAQLREIGMDVQRDSVGNSIAVLQGKDESLKPIALGSHTDTVPNGGKFDGALGVMAALAVVRALRENKIYLRHSLEIINFMAEEATMSGGTTGSQIMSGLFDPKQFEQNAWDGRLVKEHFQRAGFAIDDWQLSIRKHGELAAYLELHIEQGDALIRARKQIGVVEGLVGIQRYRVTFEGQANHAGTTSMHSRKDALVMAAPFAQIVREVALQNEIIGTVGKFDVMPNAPNVIPGRVEMIVELRALNPNAVNRAGDELSSHAKQMGGAMQKIVEKPPVSCDLDLQNLIDTTCDVLGFARLRMPSGAFHDAANMASLCPQAMIFVPSVGGVSHSPDEFTLDEDCVNGANVLLNALLKLDEVDLASAQT